MTLLVVVAVGVLAALALGDALRSGRSSSVPGTAPTTSARTTPPTPTTDTALPRSSSSALEVARTPNTCGAFRIAPSGGYPLLVVEVVAGDVTCNDARRVMKAHYVGLESGSWICHGREGRSGCAKPSGETVSAHFADALDDPEWEMEQIANRWARAFALGGCSHMSQPLCERIDCERVGHVKIRNCTPLTTAYRRSFEKARVEEIAIRGQRVGARFSNGELIELVGVVGGRWFVHEVGGQASRWVFE